MSSLWQISFASDSLTIAAGVRPNVVTELPLDRGEHAFDVRPLVVMVHEFLPAVLVVMDDPLKQTPDALVVLIFGAMNACPP